MKEQGNYEIIKKLIETNGNKNTAAIKLGCTRRNVNRMIEGYKSNGKRFFQHGNRENEPSNKLPEETNTLVADLYRTKYYDSNFAHFKELLEEREEIFLSESTIRNIFKDNMMLSPKAWKRTRKAMSEKLEALKEAAPSKKERDKIQNIIVSIEDSHPRRPRCVHFGEMIQMDASQHEWFAGIVTHLHLAIDDSTGNIVGAYFDEQETLNGYYNVFRNILKTYGIPYLFYTDKRTVFEYKKKGSSNVEKDAFTQFSYACKQLGVDIKTTSIPEAKGRVERVFQTLQSRLIVELRLAGVTTIEHANVFLDSYLQKYNDRFALPVNHTKSVFEKQPDDDVINRTLAVISERKIDSGHCIRYNNKYFRLIDSFGNPVYYYKGANALVIKAFDGQLYTTINEAVYALDEIPLHAKTSKNFTFHKVQSKPRKVYIPPMSHPWKCSSFSAFASKTSSGYESSFEEIAYTQAAVYQPDPSVQP